MAGPPATETQMLLYCDQSGGAMLHLPVWQGVAAMECPAYTLVTNADTFANHLDNSTWQSVTVLACYTENEPAYVASLRAYMQDHPETNATLFLWHPNGVMPPPHTLVVATAAYAIWTHGMTGIGYVTPGTSGSSPGGVSPKAGYVYVGYQWPDFADFTVGNWEPVRLSPELNATPQSPGGTVYDDCMANCLNTYRDDLAASRNRLARRIALCEPYGPTAVSPGNPEKYGPCLHDAYTAAAADAKAAATEYISCRDDCQRLHNGTQAQP